jgi:hypothetical protein
MSHGTEFRRGHSSFAAPRLGLVSLALVVHNFGEVSFLAVESPLERRGCAVL